MASTDLTDFIPPEDDVAAEDPRYKLIRYRDKANESLEKFKYERLRDMKNHVRLLRLFAGLKEHPNVECELFEAEVVGGQVVELQSRYTANVKVPSVDSKEQPDDPRNGFVDSQKEPNNVKTDSSSPQEKTNLGTSNGNFLGESHHESISQDGENSKSAPKQKEINKDIERVRIEYEALSWRWGTDAPENQILIRKGSILTRKMAHKDLVWALKYLRYPNKDRILWIDAVCIDQSFTAEKNHQVEMMADIYSRATSVCVWLGIDNRESQTAIKFIKNEVMKLQNFDELCEKKENSEKWQSLLSLMQRTWFSRRWVVQEIALARKAVIYCGPDEIDWDQFAIAVELFVEVETATHRLSEVMKKDPKYYHVPGWFEYVSELGASLLVQATGTIFRDYKVAKGDKVTSDRRPLLSLEYLVSTLSAFEVTECRDAIYALLAIAKDTTPLATTIEGQSEAVGHTQGVFEEFQERKRYIVDYDRDYEDVCKDFIEFCIDSSDPTRALDIICRPWAPAPTLKNVVTGKIERPTMDLPSWVPQLSGAPFDMISTPGVRTLKMGRKNADSLVGYPMFGQRNYAATETRKINREALTWRKRLVELGLDPNIGSHYSMYVEGFILDTVAEITHPSQNGAIPKEWTELAGWEHPLDGSDPPEEFWRTIVADRGKDGRNPPVYYAKACKESVHKGGLVSGAVNTSDLIHNERNSIVAQFCRRAQAVIWNRSLIRTREENNLGLAGKDVQSGDLICILHGCSVPVILRRCQKPKTRDQIKEERRYDFQHLWDQAIAAGKRRTLRMEELAIRYDKRTEAEKEEVRAFKIGLDKKLEEEQDEIVKTAMKFWLRLQRDRGRNSERKEDSANLPEGPRANGEEKSEDDSNRKKAIEVAKYQMLKRRVGQEERMVEAWIEEQKHQAKKRHPDENLSDAVGKDKEEEPLNLDDAENIGPDVKQLVKDITRKMENMNGKEDSKAIQEVINDMVSLYTMLEDSEGNSDKINDEDKDEKWHYKFLGECYIHGRMDGEAIGLFNKIPEEKGLSNAKQKIRPRIFELR